MTRERAKELLPILQAFAFGLSAEIERDMISRRTKEALELRKAQGGICIQSMK